MTPSIAPQATPVQIKPNTFDFEQVYNDLDNAFVQLHEFYPREKSPFSPKQYADAERLVFKCLQIVEGFYDSNKEEVMI